MNSFVFQILRKKILPRCRELHESGIEMNMLTIAELLKIQIERYSDVLHTLFFKPILNFTFILFYYLGSLGLYIFF